jgi:hypothetical protein
MRGGQHDWGELHPLLSRGPRADSQSRRPAVLQRGRSEDVYVVIVDPKNCDCIYLQVRDRDGNYRVSRGYLID